jgi:hypothetical protein
MGHDHHRRKASAERFKHSQSLASLRHLLSQPIVRSTIHRLGRRGSKPEHAEFLYLFQYTKLRSLCRPAEAFVPHFVPIFV